MKIQLPWDKINLAIIKPFFVKISNPVANTFSKPITKILGEWAWTLILRLNCRV